MTPENARIHAIHQRQMALDRATEMCVAGRIGPSEVIPYAEALLAWVMKEDAP